MRGRAAGASDHEPERVAQRESERVAQRVAFGCAEREPICKPVDGADSQSIVVAIGVPVGADHKRSDREPDGIAFQAECATDARALETDAGSNTRARNAGKANCEREAGARKASGGDAER